MENKIENLRKLIDEDFKQLEKVEWSIPKLSDEDIEIAAITYDMEDGYKENAERYIHFKKGAEWYREQFNNK
jgi:hypothetical protein